MSFWNKIIEAMNMGDSEGPGSDIMAYRHDADKHAFVDVEVGLRDNKVHDIGALRYDGATFHKGSKSDLVSFLGGIDFVCGHNIVHHDAKYLFAGLTVSWFYVDTLYLSPLLFPERPYHHLVKDDKLLTDQLNNPVNDCEKARALLADELTRWRALPERRQTIYSTLLLKEAEFQGFMLMAGADILFMGQTDAPEAIDYESLQTAIREDFKDKICAHADIVALARQYPCALAYALALADTADYRSVTPGWILYNYPEVEYVMKQLRQRRCVQGCAYCDSKLDAHRNLKQYFGYDTFRTYDGEPLQENAVRAAIDGESLLAIFPTGGGKSLTFQLPALIDGHSIHGLTVVISPLQSLMKDQVDNLAARGITDAVTINGLLDPLSRSEAIDRVQSGEASLLYISPEMLRSKTIEKILMARHIARFVIDEAHCFSAWGQDFRVDYLYIGKFIRQYEERKGGKTRVPVSCFTATAKQKVVQDICDYFKRWLGLDLSLYASSASRHNLRYKVIHVETDEEKYNCLRELLTQNDCPTIVYVSRTKRTRELSDHLRRDGVSALPYNGKMSSDEKIRNQEAFMNDEVRVIVATSAFGMGVDKSDVGLVVHYDISDSLENYVQEAGRAGRDPKLNASCFVLYGDSDLDKHFILLNQTKLSISEIQQVWRVVRNSTKQRDRMCCSALEIARQAGWDDSVSDIETRVRTALSALEQSGYIERGNNVPHVYATGISVKNMDEARRRLESSSLFSADEVEKAVRIIKSLISQKSRAAANTADAESRVDYLADILGLGRREVVSAVERMRQEGILADSKDITAFMDADSPDTERKSGLMLDRFARLERYVLEHIPDGKLCISYKQLNDDATSSGIGTSTEKSLRTLLYFLVVKGYVHKTQEGMQNIIVARHADMESTIARFERRLAICRFAVKWLYRIVAGEDEAMKKKNAVNFSVVELLADLKAEGQGLFDTAYDVQIDDVEEALLYLSRINALKLEGGFLVLYNAMAIRRLKAPRLMYKKADYRLLDEFYRQKIQQIHIVGEYANLMVKDYDAALRYVYDYFNMDYLEFIAKYFKGERAQDLNRNITPAKYDKLFNALSDKQKEVIADHESRAIVVAAGPGSGKTRVLVHKLASLLLLEDVKHEQLLMLTFSRAAATEFKQRLMELIGNAAHFVEIKTFHSYCFDLLGRIGNLEEVQNVEAEATRMIREGEVEPNRIGKTVLVIDEAQDMSRADYDLVEALMAVNDDMRVIAVGDDDQNIYSFRGSDSRYMQSLGMAEGGRMVEMTENYRSALSVVAAANSYVGRISGRMKTAPIVAKNSDKGYVVLTRHASRHMYQPVVDDVKHRPPGTTCVLTTTNEEALVVLALLHKEGIGSKLIQTLDGFRFWNLAEMRYFLKCIDSGSRSPLIDDDLWQKAKAKTAARYATSGSLPLVQRCVEQFEQTNRAKYRSDFNEFVFESSVEDFCDISGTDVVVSTIHKAKGREFDNVYMLVSDRRQLDDAARRSYYVGMTRAKRTLSIHTDGHEFDGIEADRRIDDARQYAMPLAVTLQLSHKDVNLGYFGHCKAEVLALRSGDALAFDGDSLRDVTSGKKVCELSKSMREKLEAWKKRGYRVVSAAVRYIVAWRPKDAPKDVKESAVLLADLSLERQ